MEDKAFVFKGYQANLAKGEILFNFSVKGEKNIDFTERVTFSPVVNEIPQGLLKSLLNNIMLILGISYWKLYCPKDIDIKDNFLTQEQAEFWNTVYTKGLGEFFYKNKIDLRGLIQFPFVNKDPEETVSFPRKDRVLLGLGGGKDSIVVAEMLKKKNKEFDVYTEDSKIQKDVAKIIGKIPIVIERELDAKLFELNREKGAYNGHIPVSVVYALLGLMGAAFCDYNSVVVGNEKSANYGNVEYLGEIINHQWSKSEEFEELFQNYSQKFITSDITYSSPIRSMSELEVVKEFVNYPQYFKVFSSCNTNFKINPSATLRTSRWCCKCPKCLFVFICLAAFLPKEKVLNIFEKDLFEDEFLLLLFEELLGIRNFKPFECVGTPQEVEEALRKIEEKGEFDKSFIIEHFRKL